ncbi:Clp protease N-terminal domain-containing protein [Saccharothrix xinjiangensis]|uniref:Clp protease N-terminal domain-containing protein n=1 Tax=Saccharothrix xinjiangensis TaxID=204798 RepID=A0ABV9XTT4_9PSEU
MTGRTARTATPSPQVVNVLAAAVRRAARLGFPFVGTENLLIALIDADGAGRVLGRGMLRAEAAARGSDHWAGDDAGSGGAPDGVGPGSAPDGAGPGGAPDDAVTALLREAHHRARHSARHRARQQTALPGSGALRECLGQAIADARGGVLTTAHLASALLRAPSGRAAELFTVRRVDVGAAVAAVRAAAEPEDAPAVGLLRKGGALRGEAGRGHVRWMFRVFARGNGLGGPVLVVVRNEAERHAVRAGRSAPAAIDLVAAVLALDDQLASAGLRLRPEHESGGAVALRAAGVDPVALLGADVQPAEGELERASAGARLVAARRGDAVVGAEHLLVALLDDPADPIGPALRGLGVDPAGLRASLGE